MVDRVAPLPSRKTPTLIRSNLARDRLIPSQFGDRTPERPDTEQAIQRRESVRCLMETNHATVSYQAKL